MVRSDESRAAAALAWGAVYFVALLGLAEWLLPPEWATNDIVHATRRDRLMGRLRALGDDRGPEAPPAIAMADERRKPLLVVALGSSRSLTAFQAQGIEARLKSTTQEDVCVANFSMPGGGIAHGLVVLGRLLREGPVPDMLVIEIFPHSLRVAELAAVLPPNSIRLDTADHDWLVSHGFDSVPQKIDPRGPACWQHRGAIVSRLCPKLEPGEAKWLGRTDDWGSCPPLDSGDLSAAHREYSLQLARQQYAEALGCLQLPGPGVEALQAMLSECRRRRIGTIMVIMPEGREFQGWYRAAARDEIRALIAGLADEYGSRVVDGWDWFGDDAFEDSHHLLAEGARAFTARLGDELAKDLHRRRTEVADEAEERHHRH